MSGSPEIWEHPIIRHMAFVFSRQEEDEQRAENTTHKNKRGFTAVDAKICSSILSYVFKFERISEKQENILVQKSMKYSKQLPDLSFNLIEFRDAWRERNSKIKPKKIVQEDVVDYMIQDD